MDENFYYNKEDNVNNYIKMALPYNGKYLINRMKDFLPPGSTVLELGMGPGKDLDILKKNYTVTGSDKSEIFVKKYLQKNPGADVFVMDALNMQLSRKFDAIYSNKVLHHLSTSELGESLKKQADILNHEGLVVHSFWKGDREDVLSGMRFLYYKPETLQKIFSENYTILSIEKYEEELPSDSILVIAKKR